MYILNRFTSSGSLVSRHGTSAFHKLSLSASQSRHALRTVDGHKRLSHSAHQRVVLQAYNTGDFKSTELSVARMEQEVKSLEGERDEAIKTGETFARSVVRLAEMVTLLENMALEKVKQGDDYAAKEVLKEKLIVKGILDNASARAETNFALAGRLAEKIGDKQAQLIAALRAASSRQPQGSLGSSSPYPASSYYKAEPYTSSSSSRGQGSSSSSQYTSTSGQAYSGIGSGKPPKWEESLMEARARIAKIETDASNQARAALNTAEASIAAARERIGTRQSETILEAKERLRTKAEQSVAEAQARLRAADAVAMATIERALARYRRGEYVSEAELDAIYRELGRVVRR